MTFTTLIFLVFLSTVFLLYWSLKNRFHQNVLLLFASYFFYGWWDYRFCLLMFATSLLDYSVGLLIYRTAAPRWRRLLLIFRDCLKTGPEACWQVDTFSGHLTGAQSPQNNMITSV